MGQDLHREVCGEGTQDKRKGTSEDAEGPGHSVSTEVGTNVCMCEYGPLSWCPGRSRAAKHPSWSGRGRTQHLVIITQLKQPNEELRGWGRDAPWGSGLFPGENNRRNIWK